MDELLSNVKVRESDSLKQVRINQSYLPFAGSIIERWQRWLDVVVRMLDIPSALIMKLNEDTIEVFINSTSAGNPYRAGEKAPLGLGLYCETVIGTQKKLHVPDARKSPLWKDDNPDVDINMISYYGLPINWPDHTVFGTVCILDRKKLLVSQLVEEIMVILKEDIEKDLALLIKTKELEESEVKYKLLAENAVDVIWVYNVTRQRYTYFSPSVYQMRGFTVEESLAQSIDDIQTPESAAHLKQMLAVDLERFKREPEGNPLAYYEVQQRCKDGRIIWVGITGKILRNFRGEIEATGITRDIDQEKKAQDALRISEASLKDSDDAKNKLFSTIAHDLKSPFNAIIGLSDLLVQQIREKDYQGIGNYAEMIRSASDHAFQLLMNLLDWSRAQIGGIVFNPAVLDISQLIDEAIQEANDICLIKSIVVSNQVQVGTMVYVDRDMLGIILRNLLSNAVKFSNIGGQVEIFMEQNPDETIIAVRDYGVGITHSDVEKLFRIDEKYSTKGTLDEQGTGLGLILCREFVEQHGGRIWVDSEPGKGSTFRVAIASSKVYISE